MKQKLTDAFLIAQLPPASGRLEVLDLGCGGLTFRITDRGATSWSFRFRDPATGKSRSVKLGNYPDISLQTARTAAEEMRRFIARGVNPAEQQKPDRPAAASKTFAAVAKQYVAVVTDEKSGRFRGEMDATSFEVSRTAAATTNNSVSIAGSASDAVIISGHGNQVTVYLAAGVTRSVKDPEPALLRSR
jgi:Arm DNA-binding domain